MRLDDLAHDSEVEAEILRAVSHMSPRRAREFLINIAGRILRNCDEEERPLIVSVPPPETEERLVDTPPTNDEDESEDARRVYYGRRTQAILATLFERGGAMTRKAICAEVARRLGEGEMVSSRRTYSLLWNLLNKAPRPRAIRLREDGLIELTAAAEKPAA